MLYYPCIEKQNIDKIERKLSCYISGKRALRKGTSVSMKKIVYKRDNKGDLILDPFTGSSTTGIMALKLERKFIGIDLEKEYLDLSIKRFEQEFVDKELEWQ